MRTATAWCLEKRESMASSMKISKLVRLMNYCKKRGVMNIKIIFEMGI
jgi:hypothetical protein